MALKTWAPAVGGVWTGTSWTTGAATQAIANGDDLVVNSAVTVTAGTGLNAFNPATLTISNANALFDINATANRGVRITNTAAGGLTINNGIVQVRSSNTFTGTLSASNITLGGGTLTSVASGTDIINITQSTTTGSGVLSISSGLFDTNDANTQLNIGGGLTGVTGLAQISASGTMAVSGGQANLRALNVSAGLFNQTGGTVTIANIGTFGSSRSHTMSGVLQAGTIVASAGTISSNGGTFAGSGGAVGVLSSGASTGGTIIATGGTVDIHAAVSGSQALRFNVNAGAAIEFDSTVGSNATIDLTSASATALRLIDGSATGSLGFSGVVTGVDSGTGKNSTTGADVIRIDNVVTNAFITSGSILTILDSGGTIAAIDIGTQTGKFANFIVSGGTTDVFLTDTVCFAEGTRILTDRGEVAVEELEAGDNVVTTAPNTGTHPVKWIGQRTLDLRAHPKPRFAAPVRIRQGAFGEDLPHRDLVVSPDHALFIDGKLVPAKLLINGMTVVQEMETASVTYYHVELDHHAVLLAEGLPAESYLDTGNRSFFANANLALMLHPEFSINAGLRHWDEDACAPLTVNPDLVRPIWTDLADRAAAMGFTAAEHETTSDPDLHVMVDGKRIRATASAARKISFVIPAGAKDIRLVSRSTTPADLTPYLGDPRELGVAIHSIVVRDGQDVMEFAADHPAFAEGWHTAERSGQAIWRWTNGFAKLPIETSTGAVVVEVRLNDIATYIVPNTGAGRQLAA